MLQFSRHQTADSTLVPEESSVSEVTVATLVLFVYRQLPVILLATFITMSLGLLYVLVTPPSYTAHATLIIDSKNPSIFSQTTSATSSMSESALVASQVEILKSQKIALAVINQLRLVDDPEFATPSRNALDWILGLFRSSSANDAPLSEESRLRYALENFQDRLAARRVGNTNVLDVSFRSYDADRAIQIANATADAYIADQLNARSQSAKSIASWLQDRLGELRGQALAAERAVADFKAKHNIVDAGGGRRMNEQEISELNTKLVAARNQVSEARAKLDRIEAIIQSGIPDATVTDTLNNPVVTRLRQQYLDLANREADWAIRYGPDHRAVQLLQSQMKEIRNSIFDELRRLAETFKSDYEIAKQREELLQNTLAQTLAQSQQTNQVLGALRELESAAQTSRVLYDNMLQRYMEAIQQQSFPVAEARMIAQALGPLKKSHPQTGLIMAGTTVAGVMIGLLIGVFSEVWRHVFRTRHEVNARLQTNCLAIVPKLKNLVAKPERPAVRAVHTAFGPRTIVSDQGFFWHVLDAPMSRFAESIRAIKLAIDTSDANKSHKIIALTSALPREGKSTISTALAQLISHSGSKTILVDCNFRHGTLSQMLTPQAKAGILEVVAGTAELDDVIWTEPYTNLAFLPTVANNRLINSHEILTSEATNALFNKLRSKYEYVIIDMSPLAPIVDARTSTQFIDSYILVIEWGRTRVEDVERALTDSKAIHENLLGVVLNKANLRVLARYDSRHRNYHSDRYYARHAGIR